MGIEYQLFDKDLTFGDFVDELKRQGYIAEKEGMQILTSKGSRKIRSDMLRKIFSGLKPDTSGFHESNKSGRGVDKLGELKKFEFGDQISNIDLTSTLKNAFLKSDPNNYKLGEEDIDVYETEHISSCSTVLMIDISHSMILYGEDRITPAKEVALALSELILTKFPKDKLHIVIFGDDAHEITVRDLPFLTVGPFHTNTKAGLRLARQILRKNGNVNKQIFMITDGKPSALFTDDGRIYKNSFGLDPKIVNKTLDEAVACRKDKIKITTFMIAQDYYLVRFIEDFTKANNGKAYYSDLDNLGQNIFVDYLKNRRKFN
ncbi:MAG: VWA domain-containing protein [Ignavibacteria bacterium]|nr:VWA domain-containing protein [Ignavibacteria bacterium]MBK7255515.1 VWA domain-containing protein [Ignavibacteria bacterium]MBK7447508.1 VWA domain-containing protein [Ignavibacteria bacterium]MBK9406237.1 VWA domain-containing protein [Ignavibacteria bacterium]